MQGKFNLRYCGNGSLGACRDVAVGGDRPGGAGAGARPRAPTRRTWRSTAARTAFVPGLIPDTIPATNRPTFQQVLEFARR